MHEPLDQTDRDICAALLRNGRASWRRIAHATGLQERTVSRRATRLFEQGLVRVTAFAHPLLTGRGDAYLMRIPCAPEHLDRVARWLAHRPETLWVTTLMTGSAVLAECFVRNADRATLISELSAQPIRDFSFIQTHRYWRTVRGWQPGILGEEQLAELGEDESFALRASEGLKELHDPLDLRIIELLEQDGRLSFEAISAEVGVAKATVRKRLQLMQHDDRVSIRAVLDPAILGFPHEAFVTASAPINMIDALADRLADSPYARWVAGTETYGTVHALLACRDRNQLSEVLEAVARAFATATLTVEPLLAMHKRSDVILPPALDPA